MSKVIVERPRRMGYDGGGAHKGRFVEPDLLVSKEGMRAPHVRNWGGKELNENLAPLRRFIQSRVGQPWDAVYSEISQHLRADNAVQQHVRDHVEDFVAVRTRIVDGEIWVTSRWGRPHPLAGSWDEFYVDPRDGILRRNANRETYSQRRRRENEKRQAEEAARVHVAKDGTEYRKVEGIWYEVLWGRVQEPRIYRHTNAVTGEVTEIKHSMSGTDIFTGKVHTAPGERYRAGRRQISNTELRRAGIQNDPPKER